MIRFFISFMLLASVQFIPALAHASPQTAAVFNHQKVETKSVKENDRRKRRQQKNTMPEKNKNHAKKGIAPSVKEKKHSIIERAATRSENHHAVVKKHRIISKKTANHQTEQANLHNKAPLLSKFHRARYQKARETAVNKLMKQLGKPYQWGGTSPITGFDCSGLVWYAYKDLLKFKIPRTANEMYHLRDAPPIKRGELEKGDLVFFQINGRGTADHVGVYLGGGKFIQSPSSGKDIQVTALADQYWQNHYVGARRVMTPTTIR